MHQYQLFGIGAHSCQCMAPSTGLAVLRSFLLRQVVMACLRAAVVGTG